jgi:mannose-1-phosphate guanylyltransferase/mannose-6-phosphate isomerase
MIQATIERVQDLEDVTPPIVVTSSGHEIPVSRALRDANITDPTLILEPIGRNTAPAVAAAALHVLEAGADPLLLVLPADHVISNEPAFAEAVAETAAAAIDGYLVTFGIPPTVAEAGYGYIRAGEPISGSLMRIAEFKEKPDTETARRYLASGDYSWNSGMFLFRASRYIEELNAYRPDIVSAVRTALEYGERSDRRILLANAPFTACPSESIDFAVMEHTNHAAVLPVDVGWNDVGSWSSLWEISDHDSEGNVTVGDVIAIDTTDSYVRSTTRVVTVAGLEGVVVVDTPDALLVTSLSSAQSVKDIVDVLHADERSEAVSDGTVFESWGTSRVTSHGPGHVVRSVEVDPSGAIPVHSDPGTTHHFRVLDGHGTIHMGASDRPLEPGVSVLVDAGAPWRVDNSTNQLLRMIQISVDTLLDTEHLVDPNTTRRES